MLDCIKQALFEESPDSADSATAAEIEALKAQIAALEEKVSIPSATKTNGSIYPPGTVKSIAGGDFK
ncbi:MAG: hypothetical protein RMZ43_019525 [Nostoc sp. CmiVER01]|uniref:hypothetical protein n=1 Tax=Nostoc sp. CmiVER01 TaxID=3075384 RepID=UPI003D160CF6